MESKKINQLATELTPSLADLTIIGDPTTGISKKITLSQMAALFTGTVEEYPSFSSFPVVGVADTIYIATDTNVLYRWNTGTSAYVELSPNIIASLVFNDSNGFDGTISLVGSTATLTITTTLTSGSVAFGGASGALSQDNSNFYWDNTNKRHGINTNAPTTTLDVFGSGIIGRFNGTSTNNAFLGFASNGTNRWSIGNVQSDHRFRIYNEATTSELATILSTGEFGIGIANPTTKFHIDGAASALIVNLDADVSIAKSISFRSDNSNRWNIEVSGTESTGNAGMNFFLRSYSDAGALIETPLSIVRSTGVTTIKSLTLTNSLSAANGGTGITSYTIGDLIYASGSTTLAKLADVATGNALISGGVGVAPSWGKIDLTTTITGTLPIANGGTGATSFTAGRVLFGNGTSAINTSANLFWDNTNSRLGINNTSPSGALHIGGALSNSADAAAITLKQTSTTATTGIYLERSAEQKGYYIYLGGSLDSLTFQRNNAGTKSDVLSLTRDGAAQFTGTISASQATFSSTQATASVINKITSGSIGDTIITDFQSSGGVSYGYIQTKIIDNNTVNRHKGEMSFWVRKDNATQAQTITLFDNGDMMLLGRSTNASYGMYFLSSDTDSRIYSSNSSAVSKPIVLYTIGDERVNILADTTSTLQITGKTADNTNYSRLRFKAGTYPDADSKYPYLQVTNGGLGLTMVSGISTVYNNPAAITLNNGVISLSTNSGGSAQDRITITSGGNVLIGTTTDAAGKLQINGGIKGGAVYATSGYVNETQTISTEALVYSFNKDQGGAGGSSSTTFNITGIPNQDGAFAFIRARSSNTAAGINVGITIQIHGTTIFTTSTQNVTKTITFAVFRQNGTWVAAGASGTGDVGGYP